MLAAPSANVRTNRWPLRSAGGPPAPCSRPGCPTTAKVILAQILVVLIALCITTGCTHRTSLEVAVDFRRAQEVFDQAQSPEDYLKAAAIYESIRERGVVSGAVLYNQGNAFMQAGRRGRAIAAYREALRYRPRDPNVMANLTYAVGKNNLSARRPLVEYIFFWQNWLGYGEKFTIAAAAGLLTFALAVVALWWQPRRLWMWFALAGLIITAMLIATSLAVCLIPVLFVAIEKMGGNKAEPPKDGDDAVPEPAPSPEGGH